MMAHAQPTIRQPVSDGLRIAVLLPCYNEVAAIGDTVAQFARAFPDAAILVTGVEDPDTRAHGIDESLHLGEFERVCIAEALLLQKLADS